MLIYFNRGLQNYLRHPPKEFAARYNWEFYAIVSGKAAPFFSESEKLEPAASTLWVMPPRRRYAWWSMTKKAECIVFNFSSVDESLLLLMAQRDFLKMPLDESARRRLVRIADELEPHYRNLSLVSSLHFDKALAELSLMAVESHDSHDSHDQVITLRTKNQIKARRALAFFQRQLPRRPLVEEVAETVGMSSTHLRRIFLEVFHEPPKQLFLMAQFERAKLLAANHDLPISDIAVRSGFKGEPDFCRVFRKYYHVTFHQWRTQSLDLKRRPRHAPRARA